MKTASLTLESLISSAGNIPETLIRAVVAQVGSWDYFETIAPDVVNHGADSGFTGFTYYAETLPFYEKHRSAIREMANYQADDFGQPAIVAISKFRWLAGPDNTDCNLDDVGAVFYAPMSQDELSDNEDYVKISNALAWYALEEVSRAYVDAVEAAAE